MDQGPVRIFIVSSQPEVTDRLLRAQRAQEGMHIVGRAADLEGAIQQAQATAPDVVLVGEPLAGEEDRLRRLAIEAPFASVIALCPREDPSCAQRALLAGARAFVLDPFDPEELCTVIREVHALERQRRARLHETTQEAGGASEHLSGGKVLAVFSAKGGVGRSMIAANLALLLHRETKAQVVLVDAQRTLGDLDTLLNLVPTSTLANLGPTPANLDGAFLRSVLLKHANGIHVLLAPQQLDEGLVPDQDGFARVLELLREMFDYVVIDTGALVDPYIPVVLQHADQLLLVIVPEMPMLQRTGLFIETARQHGFPVDRIVPVLNRATAHGGITPQHIQERLGIEVPYAIPEDVPTVTYSINQGVPFVVSHPRSPLTHALRQIAQAVSDRGGQRAVKGPVGGWSGLPKRLREILAQPWMMFH